MSGQQPRGYSAAAALEILKKDTGFDEDFDDDSDFQLRNDAENDADSQSLPLEDSDGCDCESEADAVSENEEIAPLRKRAKRVIFVLTITHINLCFCTSV